MPKVVRNIADKCSAPIIPSGNPTVFLSGFTIAVVGDPVTPHPPGGIHNSAKMVQGSATFSIHGKKVCRVGDT